MDMRVPEKEESTNDERCQEIARNDETKIYED